jgi:hypothetical protein
MKKGHLNLEMSAMRWLWLEKNCHIVLEERSPKYNMGEPDVIGVTAGRYLIEIEIKRSASDFYADFNKRHRANREMYIKQQPRQFYYLMPKDLAEKLIDKIPDWAGLMMSPHDSHIEVLKVSPVNHQSTKLDSKQCVKLARCMTNHMMGYVLRLNSNQAQFINAGYFDASDYVSASNGTYII